MNLDINQISLFSVCAGCLSSDRNLTQLTRENKELFCKLLDFSKIDSQQVLLCWECTALVRRLIKFHRQVQTAQDCLHQHAFQQKTLTRLKVSATQTHSLVCSPDECFTKDGSIECNDEGKSVNILHNLDTNNKTTSDLPSGAADIKLTDASKYYAGGDSKRLSTRRGKAFLNRTKASSFNVESLESKAENIAPLAFIKVEESESEDFNDESQNYHMDEAFDGRELENKQDVKPDVEGNPKIMLKQSEQNYGGEDFNDSDDEPLTNKQTEKRSKKRKKKEDDTKKHRGGKVSGRREKPAGVVDNARVDKKLQQLNVPSGLLQMIVLSWEEVEEERQRALRSEAFTRHEYRCEDCALGFNHRVKLENHMKKHDPSTGSALCSVCRVRCRDGHALAAHRRRHRVRWSCCRCGGRWSRAGVAADHAARAHGAPPPRHECPHCEHTAPTLAKLRHHLKSHSERQKCELCGKTFRDRTSLRTHLFIHSGEKEYACPRCGKRFLFKKAMQLHAVTHDAPALLYCHQCDMNFKNQMSYYQHMKYNLRHIDPDKLKFACESCGKRFAKAARLQEHQLAVHLKSTPIRCTQPGCGFACSSRPVLRTHMRMVHRGGRARRDHVCHACGKAYTTKKTLEGHIRSHTGERPFKCGRCPSAFGYEAALYNHNKLVHLKHKVGRDRVPPNQSNNPPIQPQASLDAPTTDTATASRDAVTTDPAAFY